jgi:hypothetical protein
LLPAQPFSAAWLRRRTSVREPELARLVTLRLLALLKASAALAGR